MLYGVYAIYDSKAEFYHPPFLMRSKGAALRQFEGMANDGQTSICQYPSDYTLFHIGMFDDGDAALEIFEAKVSLGTAIEFKKESLEELPVMDAAQAMNGVEKDA